MLSPIFPLEKVVEKVAAWQLQGLLDETDFLDSFYSGFRSSYETEIAFVTLIDNLRQEQNGGSTTILALLNLSVTMVSFRLITQIEAGWHSFVLVQLFPPR